MKMNLVDRLKRYSQKAIADALDPDFAEAVVKATDFLESKIGLTFSKLERPTGRWMEIEDQYLDVAVCSCCGVVEYFNKGYKKYNYCPTCGTKMENP